MIKQAGTEYSNILYEERGRLAVITVNRPEYRNAINGETMAEITDALMRARKSPCGVVVFTGAGDKAFVAGADIRALKEKTPKEVLDPGMQDLCNQVEFFEKPTIAAINGYALGGGLELAMACDIRIASDRAKLGLPETGLGIIPGAGGTQRLSRLVGKGRAKYMILTGAILSADEAERWGLVEMVVPHERLLSVVEEIANRILSKAPVAVRMAKIAVNVGSEADLHTGLTMEKLAQLATFQTRDKDEGIAAFLEKRTPQFKGE
mgnify:CR=1 FL=1